MSGPWLKFYPTDWRADPALRMCSMAARGLWMEMLCVMHEAEPYGTLRVNGKPVLDKQLGGLVGISMSEACLLLAELEDAGVFSRDEEGAIISRRMQRDKAKAEADKANGKGGGNPQLKKGVNPPDKGEDKAQKPEARDQKKDATASKQARANTDTDFDTWYVHYPHKVGRGQAEKAFLKALSLASIDELIAGVHRYVATKPADRQWQNPATWLNGKGWLDTPAPDPVRLSHGPPARRQNAVEAYQEIARMKGWDSEPSSVWGGHEDAERLRRDSEPQGVVVDLRRGSDGHFGPSDLRDGEALPPQRNRTG